MRGSASEMRGVERQRFAPAKEYALAAVGVGLLTIACWRLTALTGYAAIALIYLLGVVLAGMILDRGPVLLVAALSALSWNFLFIPPLFTLHIAKVQDALMFLTYFVIAIAIGSLTSRLKARERTEREREQRATALYRFAQTLAEAPSLEVALSAAVAHIKELFGVKATIFLSTESARDSAGAFFPIKRLTTTFGSLHLELAKEAALSLDERQLLEAFADQLATVIERDRLMQLAAQAQLTEEAERLRKTLLDCVSHELKTPIAAIGAASQELARHPELSAQLAAEIQHGARRLHRVVNNLLDMTRLESGVIRPKLEWCDVRELLQSALEAEEETLRGHEINLAVSDDLPLALLDYSLIEQAVAKLLANAGSYTPANLPIEIAASSAGEQLIIAVSDRGPGLPLELERVFEKFYRANGSKTGGLGLGLSIARGFIEAHGGELTAKNCESGGARFTIQLPVRMTERSALEAVT